MSSIKVLANKKIGTLKPVNGINNGPVCFGELIDSTKYYKRAAFPFIRLHDTNYPHPREVDITEIFRDFSADPDDPASYDFRRTDTYLKQCLETGAQIIYRLGVSIEHPKIKYTVHPPEDFEKWAKICRGIIRHYNDGWADGFHWGIKYWEIWNEPDLLRPNRSEDPMWTGTPEQYYELYKVTSRILKEYDHTLMIGGYAAAGVRGERYEFFNNFLDMVEKEKLPLDFFSWHIYTHDPEEIRHCANIVEAGLKRIGYEHTLSILDEWNYAPPQPNLWGQLFSGDGEIVRSKFFAESKSNVGGSFVAAVLLALQDCKVDIATFYEGQPVNIFGTIFDNYGAPQKPYYSFLAYKELTKCKDRVAVELPDDRKGLYCCATTDDEGNARIMVASYRDKPYRYSISIEGLDPKGLYLMEKRMMDKDNDFALVDIANGTLAELCLDTWMDAYSAMTISLTRVK